MNTLRKPAWLKKKIDFDKSRATSALLAEIGIATVCKEAKCPNLSECFKERHATFLILGSACTRRCAFCNVEKSSPQAPDENEPFRVAQAVAKMGLEHAVITSVTRDDLKDGGASLFVKTVLEIRKLSRPVTIELLIPDLKGDPQSLRSIAASRPEIIGHNIETVPRLYGLRPGADYEVSLGVLRSIKEADGKIRTKSALMLGLGEKEDEVFRVLEDLRGVDCDFLALGQYLRPGLQNAQVKEFIRPEQFEEYETRARALGFKHVEAGPYVRSSYKAARYLP